MKCIVCNNSQFIFDMKAGTAECAKCGSIYSIDDLKSSQNKWANSPSDFVIEAGVLKKYKGTSVDVVVPDGVIEIGGTTNLATTNFGYGRATSTVIRDGAFTSMSSLQSVTLPNSVKKIQQGAFKGCSSLTSINLPEGLTSIGEGAFSGCSSLANLDFPESLTSIGGVAFSECSSLTSISIPQSVANIENGVFSGCSSLVSVVLPRTISSIENSMFNGCSSLVNITIPDTVTTIESYAFSGCSSLKNIQLPSRLQSIKPGAFQSCTALTSLSIPSTVTWLGQTWDMGTQGTRFQSICGGCPNLTVSGAFRFDKRLYDTNKAETRIFCGEGEYHIGDISRSIGDFFYNVETFLDMIVEWAVGIGAILGVIWLLSMLFG